MSKPSKQQLKPIHKSLTLWFNNVVLFTSLFLMLDHQTLSSVISIFFQDPTTAQNVVTALLALSSLVNILLRFKTETPVKPVVNKESITKLIQLVVQKSKGG
jgi:hypothetical protein